MALEALKKKEEPKPVTVYNYDNGGKVCTTPNAEIAISRSEDDQPIQVETRTGDDVAFSTLMID
jgi:hypothetical protein